MQAIALQAGDLEADATGGLLNLISLPCHAIERLLLV